MAKIDLIMPKMGESIIEATILKWLKKEGDPIEQDEAILEIATDKVDSEVPAPESGIMGKILFPENETVAVGTVIAYLHTEGSAPSADDSSAGKNELVSPEEVAAPVEPAVIAELTAPLQQNGHASVPQPVGVVAGNSNGSIGGNGVSNGSNRFYSPLVLNIARTEGISMQQLENLPGTGKDGRVTKKDILSFVRNGGQAQPQAQPNVQQPQTQPTQSIQPATTQAIAPVKEVAKPEPSPKVPAFTGNVEIIEMDRMRQLIADHMVMSKKVSPHVTSFVEADVTNLVNWRNKVKNEFNKREGEKITFTPLFVEAVVKAIKDFPRVNSSVDGKNVILKKDINIGIATALPSGNLIVPVLKNADQMNLVGLTKSLNAVVGRARNNQLKPTDVQDGTFTLTNVGTFGNVMGTPIINQPQVAILATGAIRKKPAVIETEYGDVIAIRQMMYLSLSYDHRTVDGALGGSFLRRVADYLEQFDGSREI